MNLSFLCTVGIQVGLKAFHISLSITVKKCAWTLACKTKKQLFEWSLNLVLKNAHYLFLVEVHESKNNQMETTGLYKRSNGCYEMLTSDPNVYPTILCLQMWKYDAHHSLIQEGHVAVRFVVFNGGTKVGVWFVSFKLKIETSTLYSAEKLRIETSTVYASWTVCYRDLVNLHSRQFKKSLMTFPDCWI